MEKNAVESEIVGKKSEEDVPPVDDDVSMEKNVVESENVEEETKEEALPVEAEATTEKKAEGSGDVEEMTGNIEQPAAAAAPAKDDEKAWMEDNARERKTFETFFKFVESMGPKKTYRDVVDDIAAAVVTRLTAGRKPKTESRPRVMKRPRSPDPPPRPPVVWDITWAEDFQTAEETKDDPKKQVNVKFEDML